MQHLIVQFNLRLLSAQFIKLISMKNMELLIKEYSDRSMEVTGS